MSNLHLSEVEVLGMGCRRLLSCADRGTGNRCARSPIELDFQRAAPRRAGSDFHAPRRTNQFAAVQLGRRQLEDSRESALLREKTATLGREALVSSRGSTGHTPQGASALCCSAAPRCGGSLEQCRVRRSSLLVERPPMSDERRTSQRPAELAAWADSIRSFAVLTPKKAVWAGIACLALLATYVPWKYTVHMPNRLYREEPAGYSFIFKPPQARRAGEGVQLDLPRVLIPMAVIVFATVVVFLLPNGARQSNPTSRAEPSDATRRADRPRHRADEQRREEMRQRQVAERHCQERERRCGMSPADGAAERNCQDEADRKDSEPAGRHENVQGGADGTLASGQFSAARIKESPCPPGFADNGRDLRAFTAPDIGKGHNCLQQAAAPTVSPREDAGWKISAAIAVSLLCYPILGMLMPFTVPGTLVKTLAVIAIGVGLLRWAKAGSPAANRFQAELTWALLFAVDGSLWVASATYFDSVRRPPEQRVSVALVNRPERHAALNDAPDARDRGEAGPRVQDEKDPIKAFLAPSQRDPDNARTFLVRGNTWLGKKDYDKAIREFDEAIRLDPRNAEGYVCRGHAWKGKGAYLKACKEFVEATWVDPDDWTGYCCFARLLATCPDDAVRDGQLAIRMATKACEMSDWKSRWGNRSRLG